MEKFGSFKNPKVRFLRPSIKINWGFWEKILMPRFGTLLQNSHYGESWKHLHRTTSWLRVPRNQYNPLQWIEDVIEVEFHSSVSALLMVAYSYHGKCITPKIRCTRHRKLNVEFDVVLKSFNTKPRIQQKVFDVLYIEFNITSNTLHRIQ